MDRAFILLVFGMSQFILSVNGHGHMIVPLNRASLWRSPIYSKYVSKDFDDDGVNCGGFSMQWDTNNGNCGVCGDDYKDKVPRDHENGGKYGLGIRVEVYEQGSVIPVVVNITANHLGWFSFSICDLSQPGATESEECFKLLRLKDGPYLYTIPSKQTGLYQTKIRLPKGLTCNHCVLRWHWSAGNSWGMCSDGKGSIGCGHQETFRSCSDIAIVPSIE